MNTTAVDLLDFYGLKLTVVKAGNVKYVMFRPVAEMLGLTWKSARAAIMRKDNADLYGVVELSPPQIDTLPDGFDPIFLAENEADNDAEEGGKLAISPHACGENRVLTKQLYIQLDRVHLYLARVSTANMRAKGKEKAADWLITLQKEWGEALYQYETHGIAVKTSQHNNLKDLLRMRNMAIGDEKVRLSRLIDVALADMGASNDSPQRDLLAGGRS